MQDPAQCCSPCMYHFPYNNEVMVDPIVQYKLECQRRRRWQKALNPKKHENKQLSGFSDIWPPLKTRGAFPKYQDPCSVYNINKQRRQRFENKLKSQNQVKIDVSLPVCRVPSPISTQITKNIIRYKSPVLIGPVVKPRKSSDLNIYDRTWMDEEPPNLELRKPKSGIQVKGSIETTLADLISLGYSRPYAIDLIKRYGNFDSMSLELGESASPHTVYNIIDEQEGLDNVDIEIEVETHSQSEISIHRYRAQKFHQIQPPKKILNWLKKLTHGSKVGNSYVTDDMLIKRKTLQSHSLTNINQPTVANYKYAIQLGSYDQSDGHFSPETVNRQTLANLIVAYCFSFFKNPCQWSSQDIDDILEIGDQYFLSIIKTIRPKTKADTDKSYLEELKKLEIPINSLTTNVLIIKNRKFFYHISDPIIVGYTKSKDKRVFNLTKGFSIFFKHYNCALLQTKSVQLIIWKKKFYFVFDPTSRAKDLYPDKFGAASIISFFDLKTIVSMLLDRTQLSNCQFALRNVCVTKIVSAVSQTNDEMLKDYRLLGKDKAVLNASYSLTDPCFEWASNKQALPMCIIALIYSKILPSAAWNKYLLDKIILLGNMLYCEIAIAHNTNKVSLKNMPGLFSIGPYLIKIGILTNIVAEVAYAKEEYLSIDEGVVTFFENCSLGIFQIDTFTYAIWNQRGYYYMFDPYPRDSEGIRKWNGTAILSMHNSINSLKQTLKMNIGRQNNYRFSIHALKDLKINLCGDEFRSGRLQGGGAIPKNVRPKKKLICIDPNSRAAQQFDTNTVPSQSNISVSSSVNTIDDAYVPRLIHDHMMNAKLPEQFTSQISLHICDLNSSKLSTMDLEPVRPPSPYEDDKFSIISDDMYSMSTLYDLLMPPEDDNFSGNLYVEMLNFERKMLHELGVWRGEDYSDMEETHVEVRYSDPQTSGGDTVAHRVKILKKRVLNPPRLPIQPAVCYHPNDVNSDVDNVPRTLSKELLKDTNFIPMPDGTEIINGTDTIMNYQHKNVSLLAPFIVLMAKVVSHKYAVDTWDQSILDYIINCGTSLQDVCPFRFDEFIELQFRRIVLGSTDFKVLCQYISSIVCKPKLLDEVLRYYENVILISPNYSCAVFKKNFFYYLFDPYNSNLVGLCQGDNKPGTCFFARFTNAHQLVARILYNKSKRESDISYEAQRFVVCFVWVEPIPKNSDVNAIEELSIDTIQVHEAVPNTLPNFIGYEFKDKPPRFIINGEDYLKPNTAASNTIKVCHFASLSALLLLMYHPIDTWTTTTVDQALKLGREIFKCAKIRGYYPKRVISNLFIENTSMDVILRRLEAPITIKQNDMVSLLKFFLQKHSYLMIEFPLKCVALYVNGDDHHLFDPYKFGKDNARWIRFKSRKLLIEYFKAHVCDKDYCTFYTFCISHIRRKRFLVTNPRSAYQLQQKQLKSKETKEPYKIPFWEEKAWLDIDPIPWNRFEIVNHVGDRRGTPIAMWHEWDVEFPNDLWSLWGTLHQKSKYFSKQTRGKQTLCNCVVCIIMTRIYDFIEWNPILLDSILKAGNQYYVYCVRAMSNEDKNQEFNIEHLIPEVQVPPYVAQISCEPIVEGKMYSTANKPDLCDALKIFFNKKQKQYGIIIVNNARKTRILAFGKVAEDEYFMYDCESYGTPLFLSKQGCSYILKMRMFERLVFAMTLTLAVGDFWIYDVSVLKLIDATKDHP